MCADSDLRQKNSMLKITQQYIFSGLKLYFYVLEVRILLESSFVDLSNLIDENYWCHFCTYLDVSLICKSLIVFLVHLDRY